MSYIPSVLRYLFTRHGAKKCLFYLLFALIPAALIAYALPVSSLFSVIKETDGMSFGALWISYFHRRFLPFVLIAALVAETFVSACVSSALTYHMRIGQFGLPKFFTSVNNNFFPCFTRTIFIVLAMIINYTLFVLLDSFWNYALKPTYAVIASSFTFALIALLFCFIVSAVSLWVPTMILTGQPVFKALSASFYRSQTSQRKFFTFHLFLAIVAVAFAVPAFYLKNHFLSWMMTTISYALIFVFIHIYYFIAFFAENNMKRADLEISSYKRRL